MPLIGGGGAGNVSGGNPSGTGTSLNYIGDRAFAYSGLQQIATSFVTHLEFNTASQYMVAHFEFAGTIGEGDISSGGNSVFMVRLNNEIVQQIKVGTSAESMPCILPLDILIAPETNVKIDCISNAATSDYFTCCSLVGRIY